MFTRTSSILAALTVLCSACDRGNGVPANTSRDEPESTHSEVSGPSRDDIDHAWTLRESDDGLELAFSSSGTSVASLICTSDDALLLNVPHFRPVPSEERMSFGSGDEVTALVAGSSGDRQRGGVSGTGPAPPNLAALLGGPVSINYGSQNSGPHPAPPPKLAQAFSEGCREEANQPQVPDKPRQVSACLVQDGRRLDIPALRAIGTEPFWGVTTEGRCATYSHPDDQQGTRVWTRYTGPPDGLGTWSGKLGRDPFELRVRAQPGCSDGMSDNRYPYAVELRVHGELRRGCAQRR